MKRYALILSGLLFLCGCGGGKSSTPTAPAISVSVTPSTQSTIDQGQTVAYTATVANDSGSKGVTWSMSGTGCSGTACGTFSNTSATAATYNAPTTVTSSLNVSVTATSAADTTKAMSSSVVVNPAPSITTTTLSDGTVGTAYSATLAASGGTGTLTWSLDSGTLPAGLTLASGKISGTPTAADTSTFTVKVTDAAPTSVSVTQQLSLKIDPVPLAITTTSLSSGVVNSAYSATLHSTGGTGTITWTVSTGTLPTGLLLSAAGAISGTPTATGTSSFSVTATDSDTPAQSKAQALSIAINPGLTITTTTLPGGTVGTSYSQSISASGGTLPVVWSVTSGALPAGLTLAGTSTASGTVSGTPTATGSFSFTATAKDSSTPPVTLNQPLSIAIANLPLSIATTSLPNGVVNTAYSAPLQASGGTPPYTWTVASGSSLPSWLSISGSGTSWTIGGTPTTAATSSFTLQVSDSGSPVQTQTKQLSVTVAAHSDACETGNESALKGQYAFSLAGYTADGFAGVIGSFTADGNGNITAGYVDGNAAQVEGNGMGVQSAAVTPSGSSYTMGSDNRGCATIVTPFYTFNTRFAIPPSANGNAQGTIQEYEAAPAYYYATGQIFQQKVPAAIPTGTWVYRQVGVYYGARLIVAGTKTVGSGGSITGGEYDSMVEGAVHTYTGITGTSTTPDPTTGRYTVTTTLSGISLTRAAYLVSNTQELELTITGANTTILAGYCQLQSGSLTLSGHLATYGEGAYTAQFATYSVSGTTFTGTVYQNIQGTWEAPATPTCSYTIDSYGRVATSGASCGTYYASSTWSYPPVFYLSGPNTGFVLGKDGTLGQLVPQTATTITAGNYYFGTEEAMVMTGTGWGTVTGVAALTSTTITGTEDDSGYFGNEPISETLTVNSDGTFSTSANPGQIMGLVISPSRIIEVNDPTKVWTTITIFNAAP